MSMHILLAWTGTICLAALLVSLTVWAVTGLWRRTR